MKIALNEQQYKRRKKKTSEFHIFTNTMLGKQKKKLESFESGNLFCLNEFFARTHTERDKMKVVKTHDI